MEEKKGKGGRWRRGEEERRGRRRKKGLDRGRVVSMHAHVA